MYHHIFAKIAMKEQLDVVDYRGYEVGKVNVSHTSFLILIQVLVHIKKTIAPKSINSKKIFIEINMKKNYYNIFFDHLQCISYQ